MFSKEIFGQRLKQLRQSRNLSQEALGKVIGVSKVQISDIEQGNASTTIANLVTLAEFFGVSTDFLVGRVQEDGGE